MISQTFTFPDCEATCSRVPELEKRVEELEGENRELREENEELGEENRELKEKLSLKDERIKRLWKKLRRYDNPHTPPSRKLGSSKSRSGSSGSGGKQEKIGSGKPGRKKGHKGVTRPQPEPEETVVVEEETCPYCGAKLGEPERMETRVIEDIADPQPIKVTGYKVSHYTCDNCGEEVVASHDDLPPEGRFGYNAVVQTTLYKYHARSVHRKTRDLLEWQHGLGVSSSTVLDLTRRASDWLRPRYEKILQKIRNASVLYVDETSMKVDGKKGWIWTFVADGAVLFAMRMSRGKKVLEDVLGNDFHGKIVADGWRSYPAYTSNLQRCWAHLLRETDDLKDESEEGRRVAEELHRIYDELTEFVGGDPPPRERKKKKEWATATVKNLIEQDYGNEKVGKLIKKIKNGFDYWFTFLTDPELEPTNNRAERALREHVVQRKIIGTLRNEKGMQIHETITTVLATWEQNGLDPHEEMLKAFRNYS